MKQGFLRSMRLQTAAIIIAGFVVSHVAGYVIYSQDRRDALLITEALDIAERAAGISRLLRGVPEAWRNEVVRVSDSRALRVWTSDDPPFQATEPTPEEADLIAYLRTQLPRIAKHEMWVRFGGVGDAPITAPERADAGSAAFLPDLPGSSLATRRVVAISINHGKGDWLNFLGHINTPPSLLPEFLGLNIISAAFGVGLVAFWLVNRVTTPLTRFARAAERLGRNIHAEPLPENGPREVATAAVAFNRMQRRLARMIEGRTGLLAAISHDLRTPITQMRLRTELTAPGSEREKNLAALDEMEAIVATFLDYARATNETEERSQTDLGALVESLCADLADTNAAVSWETEDGLVLACKRLAVKRAIRNLIENALKYGQRAQVSVSRLGTRIVVRVEDDGPGIPEQDIDAMFAPFRRGEQSRNRHTGGVGLGLSIVQAISEDHGAEVRLSNRPEGGLRAELRLPA